MAEPTNGQIAYAAYAESTGGKTYDGRPMPLWDELPQRIRDAWTAAAEAVRTALVTSVSSTGARFPFSVALEHLKAGRRVARVGWNDKGMWLVLIHPGNAMHRSAAGAFDMQPCIGMKTAVGQMQPGWLASQADMLADDWCVLPDA